MANSTIKIPFLVTKPMSMMIPIWLKIFNVKSNIHKENKAPNNANGTVNIIVSGSMKLSN
mgnify:CR=1 FL=1